MTKMKTLLGPGYYNVNHSSNERLATSFTFERENTMSFNPALIAEYTNEIDQMKLNRVDRNRDKLYDMDSDTR